MKEFTEESSMQMNEEALKKISAKQRILFSCDVGRIVLPIWERQFPIKESRVNRYARNAIHITELYVYGKATKKEVERCIVNIDNIRINKISTENHLARMATNAIAAAASVTRSTNSVKNAAWAVMWAEIAAGNNVQELRRNIQQIYKQALPIEVELPQTPLLQSIAENIRKTRNFEEYHVLLDNLEEVHDIKLERITPLGLSHYVLFRLTRSKK